MVFNNPEECATPNMCFDPDFGNPDVQIDVMYGGGNVVGASGRATVGFHHKAGDNSGSISDLFGLFTDENGGGFGLRNPLGAEVHYVIRFHGPKNPAAMPDQISGYPGGCVDFAPYGYPFPENGPHELYTGAGQCQDVIFAVNSPPAD